MKIVIDIDDDIYENIMADSVVYVLDEILVENAIYNGTPLPKGHGRLIDADKAKEIMMYEMCGTGYQGTAMRVLDSEFYTPTIIEADKE